MTKMITQQEIKKLEELRMESAEVTWDDIDYFGALDEALPALISTIRELREQRGVAVDAIGGMIDALDVELDDMPYPDGGMAHWYAQMRQDMQIAFSKLNDTGGEG